MKFPINKTLKTGQTFIIERTNPTDAADVKIYLETCAAESDNLSFGPGERNLSLEEERKFLESLTGLNFGIKATIDSGFVALLTVHRSPNRPRLHHIGEFEKNRTKSSR